MPVLSGNGWFRSVLVRGLGVTSIRCRQRMGSHRQRMVSRCGRTARSGARVSAQNLVLAAGERAGRGLDGEGDRSRVSLQRLIVSEGCLASNQLAVSANVVIVACVVALECLDAVPGAVLAEFGVAGVVPVRLPGGQGTTWRAGPVVLKPADSVRAGRWFAEVYDGLKGPGFRVPQPVRAAGGDWVALGWTCWRWVAGAAADWSGVSPRWPELIAVSRALHAALAAVSVPPWRGTEENPWVTGDQVAWGERDPGALLGPAAGSLAGQVRMLLSALRPLDLPDQLIHADLAGNVLFAEGCRPRSSTSRRLSGPPGCRSPSWR